MLDPGARAAHAQEDAEHLLWAAPEVAHAQALDKEAAQHLRISYIYIYIYVEREK